MYDFSRKYDSLAEAAKQILETSAREQRELAEAVADIAAKVKSLKVGDKTNFGVVTDIGSDSVTFKAKDLPKTKISFKQRKMGSKDFVLDALRKLGEEVEESCGKNHKKEGVECEYAAEGCDCDGCEDCKANQDSEEELEEATESDLKKVLDTAKKIGGKVKGNTADFGAGAVIKFSVEKGKIKFDGGMSSGVEYFKNVKDALAALTAGALVD